MENDESKELKAFFLNLLGERKDIITKKAGEIIVNIGQPGDVTYLLKSGQARIDMFGGKHVVELEPGDFIGLMGSISPRDYEDTTVAITDCELIPIDQKRAEFLFREHPSFAFKIMQVLIDRFYYVLDLAKQRYCQ